MDLIPCPFCGGVAKIVGEFELDVVACQTCYARTDAFAGDGERGDDCPCSEYFGMDEQCECRLSAPGIADTIARLLAPDGPDGADGAGEVTDG